MAGRSRFEVGVGGMHSVDGVPDEGNALLLGFVLTRLR